MSSATNWTESGGGAMGSMEVQPGRGPSREPQQAAAVGPAAGTGPALPPSLAQAERRSSGAARGCDAIALAEAALDYGQETLRR
jgi:hypothetical protein